MAELLDDVSYLSREIGPRPAGTEEEQQAALYIADQVHKRTGFHAQIEDIKCMANADLVQFIYLAVAFVCLLVAFLLPVTSIVMFLLSLVGAVLMLVEKWAKRPVLSRLLARDISQNVVVKYQPAVESQRVGKARKIVVVANYDTGRVRHEAKPRLVAIYAFFARAAAASAIATPILILLRNIVLAGSLGVVSALLSLLCVIALVLLVIAMLFVLMRFFSAYNEGANNNASSIAAMLEVLRRIDGTAAPENAPHERVAPAGRGQAATSAPTVHGEAAARAAGVVPEGVDVSYADDVVPTVTAGAAATAATAPAGAGAPQVSPAVEQADDSAASRLRSAKAAIAALTGEQVDDEIFLDFDEEAGSAPAPEAAPAAAAPAEEPVVELIGNAAQVVASAENEPTGQDEGAAPAASPVVEAPHTASPAAVPVAPSFPAAGAASRASEPAWYTAARAKAHRQAEVPVKRSRFADALDSAAAAGSAPSTPEGELHVDEGTEERLRQVRESFAGSSTGAARTEAPAPAPAELAGSAVPTQDGEASPSSTATFSPIGRQGEVTSFEPDFEMGDEAPAPNSPAPEVSGLANSPSAEPVASEQPQPEVLPVAPVTDVEVVPAEWSEQPDEETVPDVYAKAQDAEPEDDVIEILDAELVEIIDEGEYAEDEYAEYADEDAPAYEPAEGDGTEPASESGGEAGRPSLKRRSARGGRGGKAEGTGVGSRLGGFFTSIREAIVPPSDDSAASADDDQERFDEWDEGRSDDAAPSAESPAREPGQSLDEEPLAEDAHEDGEQANVELDEDYDGEAVHDEPSRFSDLRDRMSGAFSKLTDKLSPAPDYDEQDYRYEDEEEEPIATPADGGAYPIQDAAVEGAGGEMPPIIPEDGQDAVLPVDEYRPEGGSPAAATSVDPYGESGQTMFVDEPMEVQEPAGIDVDAGASQPVGSVADAGEDEYGFEPEQGAPDEFPSEDDYDDEWDEQPARGGFASRVSGLLNRVLGRDEEDEPREVAEDEEYGDEPLDEDQPETQPAGFGDAAELTYQTAYAPTRTHATSASVTSEEAPAGQPVAEAGQPTPAETPEEPEAVVAEHDAAPAAPKVEAAELAAETPTVDDLPDAEATPQVSPEPVVEDPTNQQVFIQPDESGEFEPPVVVVPEIPASPSRPANPRAARSGRFDSTVSGWREPEGEVVADFAALEIEPIVPLDEPETVDLYEGGEEISEDPSGTVAMPRIDVSELMADDGAAAQQARADAEDDQPQDVRVNVPDIAAADEAPAPREAAQTAVEPDPTAKPHLSALIPRIDVDVPTAATNAPAADEGEAGEDVLSRTARLRRLRTSLPSMSGAVSAMPVSAEGEGASEDAVEKTGPFKVPHTTAAIDVDAAAGDVNDQKTQVMAPVTPPATQTADEAAQEGPADGTQEGTAAQDGPAGQAPAAGNVRDVADAGFAPREVQPVPERHHGLFGHRRQRHAEDETTPQEWLGVADDFDARAVGKARGDWTSFRPDDERASVGDRDPQATMGWRADRMNPDPKSDYDTGIDSAFIDDEEEFLDEDTGQNNGRWLGGAFSGRRALERERYDADDEWAEYAEYSDENYRDDHPIDADYEDDDVMDAPYDAEPVEEAPAPRNRGFGRFSRKGSQGADDARSTRSSRRARDLSENDAWNIAAARAAERSVVNDALDDPLVQEELGDTYGFVDDPIANEVWFVAQGAGLSDNVGMEEFLDAHADELRGAVVINLEGIGDGKLVGMASEGLLRRFKSTTRMKRFLRNAAQATGLHVDQAKMNWRDSAATVAMRRGMPAITVAGVEGDVPVNFGAGNDVVENLDEDLLRQRVNFILELLRAI